MCMKIPLINAYLWKFKQQYMGLKYVMNVNVLNFFQMKSKIDQPIYTLFFTQIMATEKKNEKKNKIWFAYSLIFLLLVTLTGSYEIFANDKWKGIKNISFPQYNLCVNL